MKPGKVFSRLLQKIHRELLQNSLFDEPTSREQVRSTKPNTKKATAKLPQSNHSKGKSTAQAAPLDAFAQDLLTQLCINFPMGYEPNLRWKGLRVTAGYANIADRAITLSRTVLTTEEQVSETLRHEYAHLLAVAREGLSGAGHGPAWRKAMVDLGLEPKVHHNFPVAKNRKHKEILYRCENCGEVFSRSRPLRTGRVYRHVRCGGVISLTSTRRVTISSDPS